jgi:ketosteroid isomerase-like protein
MKRPSRAAPATALALAVLLALPVLASVAIAADTPPPASDDAAIRKAGESWNAAFEALNVDALVALYATDAVLMPETAQAVTGPKGIRGFLKVYTGLMTDSGYKPYIDPRIDVVVSGNLGFRSGYYWVSDKSRTKVDSGKWLEIWRKKDGKWLIIRNMWNSDILPMFPPNAYTSGSIPAE